MIKRTLTALALAALSVSAAHATIVDLQHNDTGTINGARFDEMFQQPTGTGIIQPFLRVQSDPMEQGYNTSGGTPFDDKAGPWTHDITVTDLAQSTVSLDGVSYFKLLLDVNEPNGSKSLITLDQLQFYTSPIGSQTTTDVATLGELRYSFGPGDQVIIDASRNHGSGSGDVYIYIPTANFAGASPTDFVYMYVKFGGTDPSQGGFEEFAIVQNLTPVPEMNALFPIVGLLAAVLSTRFLRRRAQARIAA